MNMVSTTLSLRGMLNQRNSIMPLITIMIRERYDINDPSVRQQLHRQGFHITQSLPSIGALVGEAQAERIPDLESLDCVGWIEQQVSA